MIWWNEDKTEHLYLITTLSLSDITSCCNIHYRHFNIVYLFITLHSQTTARSAYFPLNKKFFFINKICLEGLLASDKPLIQVSATFKISLSDSIWMSAKQSYLFSYKLPIIVIPVTVGAGDKILRPVIAK